MLTEFLFLSALTLNSDEREALRGELNEWMKCILPKIEKESTRTAKCRLVASVERQEFGDYWSADEWRFCKFVGNNGILFDKEKRKLEEFKTTLFQKKILQRKSELVRRFYRTVFMALKSETQMLT